MSEKLILGTRGSELALTQTRMTKAFLSEALPQQVVERVKNFDFGAKEGVPPVAILYPIDFLPAA